MKKKGTYAWLYDQAGNKKWILGMSVVLALFSVLLGMVPYFVVIDMVMKLLDGVTSLKVYGIMALIMVVAFVLKEIFHEISTTCSHGATFQILANIRTKAVDKLAKMPLGDVLARPAGTIKATLYERIDSVESTLAHVLPEFTSNLVPPALLLIILFVIDWRMALASLATLPLGFLCMMGMMRGYEKDYQRVLNATKDLNDIPIEYINGLEVIKVFGKTESSFKKFEAAVKEGADSYYDWMKRCNIYFTFMMVITPSTMLSVLPIGAIFMATGTLTIIEMIPIIILSVAMIDPIIIALSYKDDMARIDLIVNEIRAIVDAPEMKRPVALEVGKTPKDSSVELNEVRFAYQKEEVLHGINLKIEKGQYVALVGPSGSGKSTIAKLIAGMWDVDSGSVSVGGTDIREIPQDWYQEKIAYVSQDNYLFSGTVMDNIRMGKVNGEATDEEVIEVAKKSGCHDFILSLENGYQTMVGKGGSHLSGGERQRLAIARAMLKDAPIVILDEATAYTDPENEAVIQESVAKLVQGKTLIVIAHRLSTIMNADQIFCIEEGNVKEKGTHEELLTQNGLYKKMWDAHMSVKDQKEAN